MTITVPTWRNDNVEASRKAYDQTGFLLIEDVLTPGEVKALHDETALIARGGRGPIIGADVIRQNAANDDELLSRILAIHFPHKASPLFRDLLAHPRVTPVLQALIGPDVKCMQSMLFVKNAGKPGQAWHQDEYYIPTRDRSLLGFWIALDDAVIENGGLWMHPGSHREGIIWPTKPHNDPKFDNAEESHSWPYPREGGVPVEVKAGSAVIFNGYVLHRSLDNRRQSGFRRAIVNHYMNARSLLPWSFGFPLKQRSDFRDYEMVCGEDPYAWKGKQEITFPYLRPENKEVAAQVFGQVEELARHYGGAKPKPKDAVG